jgi:quinol monooxygenase YgiN
MPMPNMTHDAKSGTAAAVHATTARSIRFDLVKGKKRDFTELFREQVLPALRKQEGFQDEVLLVKDDHVLGISLWKSGDALRKYESTAYPAIERMLTPMMAGKPTVEQYELAAI